MTLKLSQLRAKLESGIEFYDGAFFLEFLEHINFTVSRSGAMKRFGGTTVGWRFGDG